MTCFIAGNVWEYTKESSYIAIDSCHIHPGCKHVDVPSEIEGMKVKVIRSNAFFGNHDVESISIPENITTLESEVFSLNYCLNKVYIGPDVSRMSTYVFDSYCKSIESIIVDKNNKTFTSVDGVLFTKDMTELLFYPPNKTNTQYIVPDTVRKISEDAFFQCKKLKSIYIPSTVTDIATSNFLAGNYNKPYYDNFIIRCDSDSYAYKWAHRNGVSTSRYSKLREAIKPKRIENDIDER